MKTLLALLVLALAPVHVSLGPVSLPVLGLLALLEVLAAAGGTWLVVHLIRRDRPARRHTWLAGGAW